MTGTTPTTNARLVNIGGGIISEMISTQTQFNYDPKTGSGNAIFNGLPFIQLSSTYHSLNVPFDQLTVDLDNEITHCYGADSGTPVMDPVTGVDLTKISVAGIMILMKLAYDYEYNKRAGSVAPIANFNFVATGLDVTFTDSTKTSFLDNITSWTWNFGDGSVAAIPSIPNSTAIIQNPTFVFTSAGTYIVTLTIITGSGKTSTISIPVTVA